jgi:hypothetical protein
MWPAPIKLTTRQLASAAPTATYVTTLDSGERIYVSSGVVYAVQP